VSIKLELDADSIKKAITTHISNQGFDLAGKTVEVALVNGRGGNGNRATITISDGDPVTSRTPTTIEKVIASDVSVEETVEVVAEIDDYVKTPVEEVSVIATPELDDIMKAAEGSDPFGEPDDVMQDFFPKINPLDVEAPKSLF